MKKTSLSKQIWTMLISMKFATILLTVLGGVSMLSMLINEYPAFFSKTSIMHRLLQQHSPYSSWWYRGLLALLFLSVLFCVIQRFMPMIRQLPLRKIRTSDEIKKLKFHHVLYGNSSALKYSAVAILKKTHFKIKDKTENGITRITAGKYQFSGVGSWVSHVGLLVIFIGGVLYSTTEVKSFRYLIGEEHRTGHEMSDKLPNGWFYWDIPITDTETVKVVVDSFRVRFYEDRTMISDYRSYVSFYDQYGKKLRNHELTVNNPLIYKNISIHQSDYKPLVAEFFMSKAKSNMKRAQQMQEAQQIEDNWITGLSLKQYRGKWLIFIGMGMSFVGMFVAFMFWRRDIWVSIEKKGLVIGGQSQKNAVAFQRELSQISERINNG